MTPAGPPPTMQQDVCSVPVTGCAGADVGSEPAVLIALTFRMEMPGAGEIQTGCERAYRKPGTKEN